MALRLSQKDERLLAGECGPAARLAMSILVRMAEVEGAEEMLDISQAHIDACGCIVQASLDFAERLAELGGRVSVPTTLNMVPLDLQNWRQQGVSAEHAEKAQRLAQAYTDMGCIPTWTCAPYQGYLTPRFGQQIAWGESNAIAYANSVLGARTNRYADFIDICAAITGRVPKTGLHIKASRRGQLLFRLIDIDPTIMSSETFFAALGHLVGYRAQDRIPVIKGLPANANGDQLKAMGAGMASSGGVGLFHAIGVTPEASTVEEAFQGDGPEDVIDVTLADMVRARTDLSTAPEGAKLDAVVLGCPHYSYAQFRQLAEIVQSEELQAAKPPVQLLVITSQQTMALLQRSDLLSSLQEFGLQIALDTCILTSPLIPADARVIMTDSAKLAYYSPGELGLDIAFGCMRDCLRSAVSGVVQLEEGSW